ncbi:acyclic terpene utilization AtuA family protein [Flammeovirgaceae bacterium SG7u.111]|nr:acyclic terpene utilization AtuA family protein [Flammeovirgaceae bacterium SG7u.132]WPO38340.1 acyclic terpene utilization AtuA family protein [Flammeovirgaceae bacterium SG7u.111]
MKRKVRIGNSSGFWGDEPLAMRRQVLLGKLDYLTADYLAEVSMSILAKQQLRNPQQGYVADFIEHIKLAEDALKQYFPKIITNAGGMNPIACAQALQEALHSMGFDKKVMAVTGDNLMEQIDQLQADGEQFENFETGNSFNYPLEQLVSANVYTSSQGIVEALQAGADIVIAGRASDSALTIAPCVYELDWELDDWDKLAAGMVAGHILECGSQACGGNFTDWQQVSQWTEMGYPIVEMNADGSFEVTKAEGTGGLVNQWTVKEQLIYEVSDPTNYMGPDVVADMSEISITDVGEHKVAVSGVKGKPAPQTWKVSMALRDGYKAVGQVVVGGKNALEKAELLSKIFWKRISTRFYRTATNFIGANALGNALAKEESREILLQFVAFDLERAHLQTFAKEVAGIILAGPQGVAAYGGRPKPQEVIAYWPTLLDKRNIKQILWDVPFQAKEREINSFYPHMAKEKYEQISSPHIQPDKGDFTLLTPSVELAEVSMKDLCLARSGDKGNTANLGVLARSEAIFDFLKKHLKTDLVKQWFKDQCHGEIIRHEWESLRGFNFVLNDVLDGGGTKSSRLDPQGKMIAAAFLAQKVFVPRKLIP